MVLAEFCNKKDCGLGRELASNLQCVHTPYNLCCKMIEKLERQTTVTDKDFLVFNLEFVEVLLYDFGIEKERVYLITDCAEKAALLGHPRYKGVQSVVANFLGGDMSKHFDVVVMNPPYQTEDGGHSRSSMPVYHKFIEKIIDQIQPDYLLSVNPSRWMMGGKGLDEFRVRMMSDRRIKIVVDNQSPSGFFPNVDIAGGCNYFLWDKKYNGECSFNGVKRYLDEEDIILRENQAISILKQVKAKAKGWIGTFASPRKPYGLEGDAKVLSAGVPCWFKQSIGLAFVDPVTVKDTRNDINTWRILVPRAPIAGQTDFTKPIGFFNDNNVIIAKPREYCTETYIVLKNLASEDQAKNFVSYLRTRFFRFMLRIRTVSQDITRETYNWVPDLGDYTKPWTDKKLYKMFKLEQEEIDFIESKIKA